MLAVEFWSSLSDAETAGDANGGKGTGEGGLSLVDAGAGHHDDDDDAVVDEDKGCCSSRDVDEEGIARYKGDGDDSLLRLEST